jgi:hypothetical protein
MPGPTEVVQDVDSREHSNTTQSSTFGWATTRFLRMQDIPMTRTTGWSDADVLFIGSSLAAELGAWDAASDEALSNFEATLS